RKRPRLIGARESGARSVSPSTLMEKTAAPEGRSISLLGSGPRHRAQPSTDGAIASAAHSASHAAQGTYTSSPTFPDQPSRHYDIGNVDALRERLSKARQDVNSLPKTPTVASIRARGWNPAQSLHSTPLPDPA